MANTVKAKNIQVYLKVDATYYPIFCGKTMRFSLEQDEVETTNVDSGSARAYEAGMSNALLEVSGVTTIDNSNSRISITYLQSISVRQQVQDWKITLTPDTGTAKNYTFRGVIRSTDFDKALPGYSQSNLVVRVSGNITIDTVDPPPTGEYTYHADWWDSVNAQNYVSGQSTGFTDGTQYTLQATDVILAVEVESQTMYAVTGTPTNGEPEYKYDTSTQRVNFPAAFIFDGSQRVYIMFKRPV